MVNLVHKELSYVITGISFSVAKARGRFCRERQYADCFEQELVKLCIQYQREIELRKICKGAPAGNITDFWVDNKALVDIKAKRFVTKEDYYQMQRYLKACNAELGLIINFRNTTIKPQRVLNSGYSDGHSGHSGRTRGFSLVETLFYTVILSLSLVAVTQTLIVTVRSYGALRAKEAIETDAAAALARMMREIRNAKSVSVPGSTLGSSPGALLLNTTTDTGDARAVRFSAENGKVVLAENGVPAGALTGGKSTLVNLIFRRIATPHSEGVKIELALRSGSGIASTSESFYATAVLRDSY